MLTPRRFSFDAAVWEHDGAAAWHFVSLPEEVADEIEHTHGGAGRGFGAVPVAVTIGATRWSTSLFPDTKRGTYLLPVKRAVRQAEGLADGTEVRVDLEVGGRPGGGADNV